MVCRFEADWKEQEVSILVRWPVFMGILLFLPVLYKLQ